ncbi:MAG: hypothetical protein MUO78_10745 [candidate division Zixibacteria bacterium]|nr:hypothetical protein [candidate division Zixibacteria bacterium]
MILAVEWDGELARLILAEPYRDTIKVIKLLKLSREELAKYLSEEKRKLDIRVCGSIEGSVHKTVFIPPLKGNLLKSSIQQETKKIFEEESEYLYEELGQVEEGDAGTQAKVMVVALGRKHLEELVSLFSNYKTKPSIFTTYPLAVRTLLEKIGELKGDENVAFVDVSGDRSRILIFKGKEIRITRGLPLKMEEGVGETDRLIKDIHQTVLFYTENFPQDKIEKIVVGGSFKPSDFLEALKKKVELKVVPVWAEEIFQGSNEELLTYPGCLGLTLLTPKKFQFSLVPASIKEKRKNKKMATLLVAVFIGAVLFILSANLKYSLDWLRLLDDEKAVQGEIKKRESELKELSAELIYNSVEAQPAWTDFLLELARLVPDDITLNSLTVKRAGKKWKAEINGIIQGEDKVESFYRAEELRILFNQSTIWASPNLERKLEGDNLKFKVNMTLKG